MGELKPGWEGRYFEDFVVGDVYRCRYGRTVTEADNIQFTLLTNNTNQIHFNRDYGERTEFGSTVVNSALTLAIVAGMGVMDVSENGFALGGTRSLSHTPFFRVTRSTPRARCSKSVSPRRAWTRGSSKSRHAVTTSEAIS